MPALFANYDLGHFYNEMLAAPDHPHPHYPRLAARFTRIERHSRTPRPLPHRRRNLH